jgi:hypothetical protein
MSRKDDFSVLLDNLDQPKRTVDRVAADIAAVLKAGSPSQLFCRELARMVDPKGRPATGWRLKLLRHKQGRPEADPRMGFAMATLVDDEGVLVDEAVFQIQKKFGAKGNSRTKLMDALKRERELRQLAELVDKGR